MALPRRSSVDSASCGPTSGLLKEPLEVLQDVASQLTEAKQRLQLHDPASALTLEVVGRRLQAAEDELQTQLAEVESAGRARQDERLLTRRLMATLPIPLITTNVHGAIIEANAAACELFAVPAGFLAHKPVFTFVDASTRRAARHLLHASVSTDSMVEAALSITPRDAASPRTCHVTLLPVPPGPADAGSRAEPEVSWVIDPQLSTDGPGVSAYHATLLALCRLGVGDADLRSVLRRVAELATAGIAGVDAVSVMLGAPNAPDMLASSSAQAQAADGVQYQAGAGPIFDAFHQGQPIAAVSPFSDPRWPQLAQTGVIDAQQNMWLALPLEVSAETVGVMVLYAQRSRHADPKSLIDQAGPYVAAAETLVRDSHLVVEMSRVRDELVQALHSRATIDQAKGMIMITRGCSADEAFSVLVHMSNTSNRKVRELAASFVEEASGKGPNFFRPES